MMMIQTFQLRSRLHMTQQLPLLISQPVSAWVSSSISHMAIHPIIHTQLQCTMLIKLSGTLNSVKESYAYICSWDCKHSTIAAPCCHPCLGILKQKRLQGIIQHINNGTPPNSPHQYWSWGTLQKALQSTQEHLATKNLSIFNASVTLPRQTPILNYHKHLI